MADEHWTPEHIPIYDLMDVVTARRRSMELALEMGFARPDATKIAVVVSELSRNIRLYAVSGTISLAPCTGGQRGFKIVAQDQGPGIEDVELVLAGGYTTSNGLGLGISGSRRLMDEFEIQSVVGAGTTITAVKWLR
jgi:serine/threonine-protein kinase RsbT